MAGSDERPRSRWRPSPAHKEAPPSGRATPAGSRGKAGKAGKAGSGPVHRSEAPATERPEPVVPTAAGARRIEVVSWSGTAVLALTAIPAAIAPDALAGVALVTALVLFSAGTLVFFWAYLVAIGRSRTDLIGIGGLYFLAGSAPRAVQRSLIGSFAAQIAIGVATAWVRIFTPLAFGVLAPMFGLGLMGLWGAKYGTFPPRPHDAG